MQVDIIIEYNAELARAGKLAQAVTQLRAVMADPAHDHAKHTVRLLFEVGTMHRSAGDVHTADEVSFFFFSRAVANCAVRR